MKVSGILLIVAACVLPQFAHAGSQVTAQQLAGLTAAVDSCSRADHRSAGRLEDKVEHMLKGMSRKSIELTRKSGEYKTAYGTFEGVFNELPKDHLAQLCVAASK